MSKVAGSDPDDAEGTAVPAPAIPLPGGEGSQANPGESSIYGARISYRRATGRVSIPVRRSPLLRAWRWLLRRNRSKRPSQVSVERVPDATGNVGISLSENIRAGLAVSIYVKDDDLQAADALIDAIAEIYRLGDATMVAFGPIQKGSWFQQFRLKLSQAKSSKEGQRLLAKSELAIQAAALDEPQSRANVNNSAAVSNLINAIQNIDTFVTLTGSILLVKYTDQAGKIHVRSKTLSAEELIWLEKNQDILRTPEAAVKFVTMPTMDLPLQPLGSTDDDSSRGIIPPGATEGS